MLTGVSHVPSALVTLFLIGKSLRPLRIIRLRKNMRVVVGSLIASRTDILNVYFLTQLASLLLAIVGMSMFSGSFYRCSNPQASGRLDCVGTFTDSTTGLNRTAVWTNPTYTDTPDAPPYSFDNIWNAFLLVKEVQVSDAWSEVVEVAMDITAMDKQPHFNASRWRAVYFMAVVTVGTFFFCQLYTGVIVSSYSRSDGTAFMTPEQRQWVASKKQVPPK